MFNEFNLYDFASSLSIFGWVAIMLVLIAIVYVLSKAIEILVTKRCPFCERRIPKRAIECSYCKQRIG